MSPPDYPKKQMGAGALFVTIEEAIASLNPRLARRLPHGLHAIKTRRTAYLEDGQLPHGDGNVALTAVRA